MDKKQKKILISATAGVLAVALAGGTWFGLAHRSGDPVYVYEFMNVGMTEFWGDTQDSYGPVSTDNIQTVFLSKTQEITDVLVQEGDTVKKGDLLMTFDTTLSDIDLERKRLEVEKLKLQLEDEKRELNKINSMRPMQTPPPMPDTPAEQQDLGPELSPRPGFRLYGEKGKFDGSSKEKPLICWIRDDAFRTEALWDRIRLEAAGYQLPDSTEPNPDNVPGVIEKPGSQASAFAEDLPPMFIEGETVPVPEPQEDLPPAEPEPQQPPVEPEPQIPVDPEPQTPETRYPSELLPEDQGEKGKVTAEDGTFVRLQPDLGSEILPSPQDPQQKWELKKGDPVLVFEILPGVDPTLEWGRIQQGQFTGWVLMDTVALDRDGTEPLAPAPQDSGNAEPHPQENQQPESYPAPDQNPAPDAGQTPGQQPGPGQENSQAPDQNPDPKPEPDPNPDPGPETQPDPDPKPDPQPDPDLPTVTSELTYVVIKETAGNKALGEKNLWLGMELGRDNTFKFFSAVSVPDFSLPEMAETEENFPEFDMGSGLTAGQIAQMRDEQKKKIKEGEFKIKMAEADYKIKKREMEDGNIYAEFDGKVVSLLKEEEARKAKKPMMKVSGGGGFIIEGTVSELNREKMKIGQEVTVNDWNTGETYQGKVLSVGDFPVSSRGGGMGNPNSSMYPFKAFVDGDANLQAGSMVSLQYSAGGGENGVYLENPFLRREKGQSYVYVMGDNKRLEKRYVTTGKSLWGNYTEIRSGLTAEDLVAFPYGKNVKPGVKARIGDMSDLYS